MAWALEAMGIHSGENLKHSEETKIKMSEYRLKFGVWNKGKIGLQKAWNKGLNKETSSSIRIVSEKMKGRLNPMFGKVGNLHPNSKSLILFNNHGEEIGSFQSSLEFSIYCKSSSTPFNGLYSNLGIEYNDGSKNGRFKRFNGFILVASSNC